jgi:glycine/D-amino acid oxidase-like deaminating enzyme
MRIGVLGGGLQGCCLAVALAARGADVTIFDRNAALISKAGIANEGKIHLGYMYANDLTLRTARRMMSGALAFAPFMERHLGRAPGSWAVSMPATYVVHRHSQQPAAQVRDYFDAVHRCIAEALPSVGDGAYFGLDVARPPRRLPDAERAGKFDPEHVVDAIDICEVAVDPVELAAAFRARIAADPRIEVCLGTNVLSASPGDSAVDIAIADGEGRRVERFDQVVNALWDGRLALNATAGIGTDRQVIHRLKYGVSFRLPEHAAVPPSATIISGPFGEVVSYGGGLTYLTWYPTCLREISQAIAPPDWPTHPADPLRSDILSGTLSALSEIVPALKGLDPKTLPEAIVKGGCIVAWGETDIYDRESELHRRYDIGITTKGRFHAIDPGKLTLAPLFAEQCADRIFAANG